MAKNLCTRSEFVKALSANVEKIVIKPQQDKHNLTKVPLPDIGASFTAYKLDGCPYSDKAGKVLQGIPGSQSYYIHRDLDSDKHTVQDVLSRHTEFDKNKHKTFPIVYAGEQFLGGFEELSHRLRKRDVIAGGKRHNPFPGAAGKWTRKGEPQAHLRTRAKEAKPLFFATSSLSPTSRLKKVALPPFWRSRSRVSSDMPQHAGVRIQARSSKKPKMRLKSRIVARAISRSRRD